ncbi:MULTISPECIES: pimeloyl-ACP methyl esterase BioG family protein [Helicobacter]|uniref:DUF452 family protein n=1 Tax=Helicobacter ibis TaxID=2962633 RepID=A0ABT4VEZ6_9HELI|nr:MULTISPECIES: pimeloyl-ACP methyl esterase BioG family protein [Helicobacter]MDA3967146.1 DUF452 family protein [Helicobacter sp. WB40]MDA3969274.1 DUF452 family protein [Helicobacter ibis]
MNIYHKSNNNKDITLIFGGFASHYSHFLPFFGENIVVVYGYNTLKGDNLVKLLQENNMQVNKVVAFSMGVWVFYMLYESLRDFVKNSTKVAVNGTGFGIDRAYGINPNLFKAVYRNFDFQSFVKNLFGRFRSEDFLFLEISVLKDELLFFIKNKEAPKQYISWDKVYISKDDSIFSSESQVRFWEREGLLDRVVFIDSPHFAFFTLEI